MLSKRWFSMFVLALIVFAGCKKDPYNFDALPPTVKSFFTTSDNKFNIDEDIKFNNASEDAETYIWNFGDGTTSTEQNPTKVYAEPGLYTVTLTAVGAGGTGRYSSDFTIIDPNAHVASNRVLYFIEYSAKAIKKISLEPGSAAELVANITGKSGVGLAYDSVNKKIYFSDFENTDAGKIWRMNMDGSGMEEIASGITDPYSIAINLKGGKVYWADNAGNISRANLDGSSLEREFIHVTDGLMRGIAFDSKNNVVYFYEVNEEVLYAAKTDGTSVSKIIEGSYGYSLFVDEVNGKIYFEDRNVPAIMQANLDGSGVVKIVDVPSTRVHGMAIDYDANKFYWADRDKGVIRRSNLDGTEVETFLSGLRSPRGLFIQ
jgi:PKD repeat protein